MGLGFDPSYMAYMGVRSANQIWNIKSTRGGKPKYNKTDFFFRIYQDTLKIKGQN